MTPFSPATISWSTAVDLKLQSLWEYAQISHPSSHVWMWELDHKESWVSKNWCFWTVVLEKTLESPLDGKEIKPVHPKGNQPWILIGRTDAEAEVPILWPLDAKNWLIGKKLWCWARWKAEEGDNRGWDDWMASPTQWTWVWANSRNWWWIGKPDKLQSMESQRVGHNWGTELNQTALWSLYSSKQTKCEPENLTIAILSAIYFI